MKHTKQTPDKRPMRTGVSLMTLKERILQIDPIQARRFASLTGSVLEIATEGIVRHLRACARMDVNPDPSAVREVIDDAHQGRRVYAETSEDRTFTGSL